MKVRESAEMYLETILILSNRSNEVRSIDIVNEMNYSKPTVSVAMKQLRENGYIKMDDGSYITLTSKGREIAERIYERHQILSEMLTALGVDKETATADACRIEHHISEQTFECVKDYYMKHRDESGSKD